MDLEINEQNPYHQTYQNDINLHSLINFKDFFASFFDLGELSSVCEIGVEPGTFSQWLIQQADHKRFNYFGIDPKLEQQLSQSSHNVSFINKKSIDYLSVSDCPAHDIYFIDGDHNFHTVYQELKLILDNPAQAQKICVLHDIGSPCARKERYYDINDIPKAYRQTNMFDGRITLDNRDLSRYGFETCSNAPLAIRKSSKNNSVLTAIEKIIKEYARKLNLEFIKLPIFYGLGILYDKNQVSAKVALYLSELKEHCDKNYKFFLQIEKNRLELYLQLMSPQQNHDEDTKQIQDDKSFQKKVKQAISCNTLITTLQDRYNALYQYHSIPSTKIERWLSLLQIKYNKRRHYHHGTLRYNDAIVYSLNEIVNKVSEFEVVSFDFFDTLVHRKVSPPDTVTHKTAQYAALLLNKIGRHIYPQNFVLAREVEENRLREQSRYYDDLDDETDIESIFQAVIKVLTGSINNKIVADLIDFEVAAEIDHLYLNQDVKDGLSQLKDQNKKIIICSDMYLREQDFWKICDHFDISQYIDKIYISSTQRIAKYSGKIFHYILNDLNVAPNKMIHVGDNAHSDCYRPKAIGIQAYYFYYAKKLRHYIKLENNVKEFNAGRNYFTQSCKSTIKQFNLYSRDWCSDKNKLIQIAVSQIAPVIAVFAHQALTDIIKLGIRKVYFLAREGIFLHQAFDLISNTISELKTFRHEMVFKILHVSRVSTIIGSFNGIDDIHALLKPEYFVYSEFNIINFLKVWGVSLDDFSDTAKELIAPYLATCSPEAFRNLLTGTLFSSELDKIMKKKQQLFYQFLQQEGVADNESVALVDLGWNGTIQNHIATALKDIAPEDNKVFGFYFGTKNKAKKITHNLGNSVAFPGYIFNDIVLRESILFEPCVAILETFVGSEKINSVNGYTLLKDGKVMPRYKCDRQCGHTITIQEKAQPPILSGIEQYANASNLSPLSLNRLKIYYKNQLLSFINKPTGSAIRNFDALSFDRSWDNDGVGMMVPIIYKPPLRMYMYPRQLVGRLLTSPWPNASLKALRIPFLCQLYVLYIRNSVYHPRLSLLAKWIKKLLAK